MDPFSGNRIEEAHRAIEKMIHRSPVLSSEAINGLLGSKIHFKCENLQKIGAFKMRGASYFIDQLLKERELKDLSVVTHSSGNHAQAVALAAKKHGIKAYIVMPEDAPKVKVKAVRSYDGEIIFCKPTLTDRESSMERIRQAKGSVFIPPFDHEYIILGQATAAKELIEEHPRLDFLLAPVGGGGLLAGTALAAKAFAPNTKVIGCEPEMADDAYRSFKSGSWHPSENPNTLGDGLKTSLGKLNFEIIKTEVDDILCCSEAKMIEAMRLVWERMKMVIEPSAAVPLACMLQHPKSFRDKNIGIILSGGNVDLDAFFEQLKPAN